MGKEFTGPQVLRLGAVSADSATAPTLPKPATSNQWYKKARLIRRDPTVSLVRRLVVAPALASTWSYETVDDTPEGAMELIRDMMEPMRNHIIATSFFGCIDFGWQPYELIFEQDSYGNFVISKIKPLIQDFTEILIDKKTGAYAGLKQEELELDVENTFLHSWDVEGTDWYGEALMRSVESVFDDSYVVRESANRYDTKIAGSHWVIYYPLGRTLYNNVELDNYAIAQDLINRLRSSGSIAIPRVIDEVVNEMGGGKSGWEITLVTDGGATSTSFIARSQYLDALKARAFGVPERAVLEGQFGTKAEAQEHGEMAVIIVEMRHTDLCQKINWHIVNRVLRFNYGPQYENSVKIQPSPLTDKQRSYFEKLYSQILGNADGFLSEYDEINMEVIRDRLDIPRQETSVVDMFPTSPEITTIIGQD